MTAQKHTALKRQFILINKGERKGEKKNEKNHEFVYGNYINIRIDKYGKCRE